MNDNHYEQFVAKLEQQYPVMFSRPYGGVAVDEGWWPIIETLCAAIDNHLKWKQRSRVQQIKLVRAKRHGIGALVAIHQGRHPVLLDHHVESAKHDLERDIVIPPKIPHVFIEQIKEKFGGLRFYYQGGDDYISGLVSMAEDWANRSCEMCGAPGKKMGGGWIRTVCEQHGRKDNE